MRKEKQNRRKVDKYTLSLVDCCWPDATEGAEEDAEGVGVEDREGVNVEGVGVEDVDVEGVGVEAMFAEDFGVEGVGVGGELIGVGGLHRFLCSSQTDF